MSRWIRFTRRVILALILLSLALPYPGGGRAAPTRARQVIDVPFFSQAVIKDLPDKQGNPILLGNSTSTLWEYGCGVASLAMVFRKWGLSTCVQCLNETLKQTKGFSGAYLTLPTKPENIAKAGEPFISSIVNLRTSRPEDQRQKVNQELAAGRPVIIFLKNAHFVVITGIDENGGYLINDPAQWDERTGKNIPIEDNILGYGFKDITQFDFVYPTYLAPTNGIVVRGAILDEYRRQGGSSGLFGNPLTEDTEDTHFNDLYPYQEFQNGAIIVINNRALTAHGPVWSKIKALGGYQKTGLPLNSQYAYWSVGRVIHTIDLEGLSLQWNDGDPQTQVDILDGGDPELIRVEFFNGSDPSGSPSHIGRTWRISYDWKDGSPVPFVAGDQFAVRWTAKLKVSVFTGWFYTFYTQSQGRYRILIDGKTVLDAWDKPAKEKFTQYLGKGEHTIGVEFSKIGKDASVFTAWSGWPVTPVFADGDQIGPVEYMPVSIANHIQPPAGPASPPVEAPAGGFSAPEQPVIAFFSAVADKDADRAVLTLAPSSRLLARTLAKILLSAADQQAPGVRVIFDEMDYEVSAESGDEATVTVDGIAKFYNPAGELTDTRYFNLALPVSRQDGAWYISADLKQLFEEIEPLINGE